MKHLTLMLVTAVSALALAPTALAGAPVITRVGHVQKHPSVSWTLAPGTSAYEILVARSPETGSDGRFFSENVVAGDVFWGRPVTHWLSSSDRLLPGLYYVRVSSEWTCGPWMVQVCTAWSEIARLEIPSDPPKITKARIATSYSGWHMSAELTVCNDDDAPLAFRITERLTWQPWHRFARKPRGLRLPHVVHRTIRLQHDASYGECQTHFLSWRLMTRSKLQDHIRVTVTIDARDSAGLLSNSVSRFWRIHH